MGTSYSTSSTNNLTVVPTTNIDVNTAPIGIGLTNQGKSAENSSKLFADAIVQTGQIFEDIATSKNDSFHTVVDDVIKLIIFIFFISLVTFKGAK